MLGSGIRVPIQHPQGGIAVVAAATVLTGPQSGDRLRKPLCFRLILLECDAGIRTITWLYVYNISVVF